MKVSVAPTLTVTVPLSVEYTGHWVLRRSEKNGYHLGGDAYRDTSARGATVSLSFESMHAHIIFLLLYMYG